MRNVVLSSKVEGSVAIIFIVKEGTSVKKGDLVCELDSSLLSDRETQQEILAERALTALNQGREDLKIQVIQNTSETEATALRLKLAEIDLIKFKEGDLVQQKNDLESQIMLADENLSRAQESYDYVKRMAKSGYKTQNDLESERIAVETQRINKELFEGKKTLLLDFIENRTMIELEAKVDECRREIERTNSRTKSALIQKEAELHARELVHEVEHNKHERMKKQIVDCKIYAPLDGQVVYANIKDGRAAEQVVIDEGVLVRERQAIINIPDLDKMKVSARIHESRISMVRPGLSVNVKVDAYSDQVFHGVVDQVSSVPSSTGGFSSNIREYDAAIRITDSIEKVNKLRPGLNASTEILVERREDVLQIPIQANVTIGSKQFVFVVKGKTVEQRSIKVGKTNSNFIEILDGLVEGDEVVINPHSHFQKEISDLEEQLASEQAKQAAKPPEVIPPVAPGTPADKPAAAASPATPGESSDRGQGRRRRAEGEGGPQGSTSEEGRPSRNLDPMARFNQMDKDQDGKVSKDEAGGRIAENFDRFDTNADGSVTKEEFLAAIAKFSGGGGRPRPADAGGN